MPTHLHDRTPRRRTPAARVAALALLLAGVLALTLQPATAHAVKPVNASWLGGVAIEGTDPVAYFTEGRPVPGDSAHSYEWNGATWRFANAVHRAAFAADPARYAPQYGGYCAWAVSEGYTASIDPEAWRIVDGKLYLNYSKAVQARWLADLPARIHRADANWPRLLAEP